MSVDAKEPREALFHSDISFARAVTDRRYNTSHAPKPGQHGCSAGLEFSNDLANLQSLVDWPLLNSKNFKRDPEDPGKQLRYQAEAMVHSDILLDSLRGIVCHSEAILARIRAMVAPRYPNLSLKALPHWYF